MINISLFFLALSKYGAKVFLSDIKSEKNQLVDTIIEDLNGEEYPSGELFEYFTIIEYSLYQYNNINNKAKIKIINPGKSTFLTISIL